MEFINVITQYAIPFLLVLTVLVFVHELGHFLLARWNGVKVEVFSIGFGPELWGFNDKHETRWRFSAIPLGGYVKMFGEGDVVTGVDDTEDREMTDSEKAVSFHHKRLGQRAAIVVAGPAANFIFAVLVFWVINSLVGMPTLMPVVGDVVPDTAASEAGFETGDVFLSIDGQAITQFSELSTIVSANANNPLNFEIQRGDKVFTILATPRPFRDDEQEAKKSPQRGLLGVRPDVSAVTKERVGLIDGLMLGAEQTYAFSVKILAGVGEMFSGDRSAKELGGIILIAEVSGNAAQGGIGSILYFLAILSINLGLINLFPVPVLDGGHLAFYAIEAIRRKPLSPKIQEYGFRLGLFLVFLLMIFATGNDLVRLWDRFGLG